MYSIPFIYCRTLICRAIGDGSIIGRINRILALAKIVNAAGLFVLVSTPNREKTVSDRVWKLVLSMLFILTSVIFISIYPGMADLIYGSGGIKPVGNIIIVAIGIIYAYNTVELL